MLIIITIIIIIMIIIIIVIIIIIIFNSNSSVTESTIFFSVRTIKLNPCQPKAIHCFLLLLSFVIIYHNVCSASLHAGMAFYD